VCVDEPLANLDPVVRERVREHLVAYADAGNTFRVDGCAGSPT